MEGSSFIQTVLPYLYGVLVLAGTYALVQLGMLFMSSRKQLVEISEKVQPIIEKTDTSVETLNAELVRMGSILEDVEQMTSSAAKATKAVEGATKKVADVTSVPLEVASNIALKLKSLFSFAKEAESKPHLLSKGAHSKNSGFVESSQKSNPVQPGTEVCETTNAPLAALLNLSVPTVEKNNVSDAVFQQVNPDNTQSEVQDMTSGLPHVVEAITQSPSGYVTSSQLTMQDKTESDQPENPVGDASTTTLS